MPPCRPACATWSRTSRRPDTARGRCCACAFGIEMTTTTRWKKWAKQFDVTRERIRQIEAKALRKLKHPRVPGLLCPHCVAPLGGGQCLRTHPASPAMTTTPIPLPHALYLPSWARAGGATLCGCWRAGIHRHSHRPPGPCAGHYRPWFSGCRAQRLMRHAPERQHRKPMAVARRRRGAAVASNPPTPRPPRQIQPHLAPGALVLTLQNGADNDDVRYMLGPAQLGRRRGVCGHGHGRAGPCAAFRARRSADRPRSSASAWRWSWPGGWPHPGGVGQRAARCGLSWSSTEPTTRCRRSPSSPWLAGTQDGASGDCRSGGRNAGAVAQADGVRIDRRRHAARARHCAKACRASRHPPPRIWARGLDPARSGD